MNNNYIIVMAGGAGTRLWPLSTSEKPKQFLDLLGIGKTMLQLTIERFSSFCPKSNVLVVTSSRYKKLVEEQCPEIPESNILLEPTPRNTAPCIAYACHKILKVNPNAKLLISPADHLITNQKEFEKKISEGFNFINSNEALLTLGIKPNKPSTSYGYIQAHKAENQHPLKVEFFKEKPDLETAKTYIKKGNFYWNSGIFMSSLYTMLRAFDEFLPEISQIFKHGKMHLNGPDEEKFINQHFSLCKSISIDYGIMENATNTFVIPADFGWSDLGTFSSVFENTTPKDEHSNAVVGNQVELFEVKNSLLMVSKNKKVIVQGLKNFIVIETENTLMILQKDKEEMVQEFRDIQEKDKLT